MTSPQGLRVDIAAAEAGPTSDAHDTDNDPQRLLKLSHSLRYQLAQPIQRPLNNFQQPKHPPQIAGRNQFPPYAQNQVQQTHQVQQPNQLPPLTGPGTKSGPYQGFASKAWLQGEFAAEVEELRQHLDEYVTKREHRAFDLERAVFKAEIAHLRKRLEEEQDKVKKLEKMLPDEDGEFKSLKAELEELDEEADRFCNLYEREAKATAAALEGFRRALADVNYIEAEFQRIRDIIDTLPDAASQNLVYGYGAPGHGMPLNGALPPQQPQPVEAVTPRGCCGYFRRKRQ